MGDSFYHIFTTPYLFLLTLFFGRRGVGIHNVITKIYHMSGIYVIYISHKYSEVEIKKMLKFLIDNIYIVVGTTVFCWKSHGYEL
jgi:hypothetical protein